MNANVKAETVVQINNLLWWVTGGTIFLSRLFIGSQRFSRQEFIGSTQGNIFSLRTLKKITSQCLTLKFNSAHTLYVIQYKPWACFAASKCSQLEIRKGSGTRNVSFTSNQFRGFVFVATTAKNPDSHKQDVANDSKTFNASAARSWCSSITFIYKRLQSRCIKSIFKATIV